MKIVRKSPSLNVVLFLVKWMRYDAERAVIVTLPNRDNSLMYRTITQNYNYN